MPRGRRSSPMLTLTADGQLVTTERQRHFCKKPFLVYRADQYYCTQDCRDQLVLQFVEALDWPDDYHVNYWLCFPEGRHTLYHTWAGMLDRCENPNNKNYHNYGGRGIKVCDRWRRSFKHFVQDMGIKPGPEYTIDRTNNDGDYTPVNCWWATPACQQINRRRFTREELLSHSLNFLPEQQPQTKTTS